VAGRLDGTVALVTGASSGIGAATAAALAAEGAAVSLLARRRDRLEALAGRLRDGGGRVELHECDITDAEQVAAAVAGTVSTLGRLDTLVNSAGVMHLGRVEHTPVDDIRRMVQVNLLGLLYATSAALPHLLRAAQDPPRRVADLVNVSSVAGRHARPGGAVYSATKFAVTAFSEALRGEVTARHVRVSSVEPGVVDTELVSHNVPAVRERMARLFGDIERLTADDIADTVTWTVTRPRHVAVNELTVRPTEQER